MAFHNELVSSSFVQTPQQATLLCITAHIIYFWTESCAVIKWDGDCRENVESLWLFPLVHRPADLHQKSQSAGNRAGTVLKEAKKKVTVLLLVGPREKLQLKIISNSSIFLQQNYNALVTYFKIHIIQLFLTSGVGVLEIANQFASLETAL